MGDMAAGLGGVMPAELSATDSDGALSDSGADDSDGSDALAAEPMLRLPLAMGKNCFQMNQQTFGILWCISF